MARGFSDRTSGASSMFGVLRELRPRGGGGGHRPFFVRVLAASTGARSLSQRAETGPSNRACFAISERRTTIADSSAKRGPTSKQRAFAPPRSPTRGPKGCARVQGTNVEVDDLHESANCDEIGGRLQCDRLRGAIAGPVFNADSVWPVPEWCRPNTLDTRSSTSGAARRGAAGLPR